MWDLRVLPFSTLPSRPLEHFSPRWSPVGAFSPLQEAAEIHYVAAADYVQVVVRPVLLARSLSRPVRGWSWASPSRRRLFLARGPGSPRASSGPGLFPLGSSVGRLGRLFGPLGAVCLGPRWPVGRCRLPRSPFRRFALQAVSPC